VKGSGGGLSQGTTSLVTGQTNKNDKRLISTFLAMDGYDSAFVYRDYCVHIRAGHLSIVKLQCQPLQHLVQGRKNTRVNMAGQDRGTTNSSLSLFITKHRLDIGKSGTTFSRPPSLIGHDARHM
jgi:hypothetical protein